MKKSFKVLLSLLLTAVILITSTMVFAAALPRPTQDEANAEGEQKIYFDFPDGIWGDWDNIKINKLNNAVPIYCHPYAICGNTIEFFEAGFEAMSEQCTYMGEVMRVRYDLNSSYSVETGETDPKTGKKVKVTYYRYIETHPDAEYGVIFSTTANGGFRTANIRLTSDCIGDTVVLDDPVRTRENEKNSAMQDYCAHWENHPDIGTLAIITSTGKFCDGCFPESQPRAQMLSSKLKDYLTDFIHYPYFQVHNTLSICDALGVTPEEVYEQYITDYADLISSGEVEPANNDPSDKENGCPVDFIRYKVVGLDNTETEKKLPSPDAVKEALGIYDEELDPDEPSEGQYEGRVEISLGDVDGDKEVSILDATCIQRELAGLTTEKFVRRAADADGDGEVTILDATFIQRWLASLPSNDKIGKRI